MKTAVLSSCCLYDSHDDAALSGYLGSDIEYIFSFLKENEISVAFTCRWHLGQEGPTVDRMYTISVSQWEENWVHR